MFKLGEEIPAVPVSFSANKKGEYAGTAKVVYIHPEGTFYTLEFTCARGSYRESRLFTDEEREAGRREGIFRIGKKQKVPVACPPGFIMNRFENEDASSCGRRMKAKG